MNFNYMYTIYNIYCLFRNNFLPSLLRLPSSKLNEEPRLNKAPIKQHCDKLDEKHQHHQKENGEDDDDEELVKGKNSFFQT